MSFYKKYFNLLILLSFIIAIILGVNFPSLSLDLKIIGDLFLRLLKMLIIPVIFFSMLLGILNLGDPEKLGKIGLKTFIYYFCTTGLAVVTGLILVNLIQPGKGFSGAETLLESSGQEYSKNAKSFLDVVTNIIPDNILLAATENNVLAVIFFAIFLGIGLLKVNAARNESFKSILTIFNNAIIWMIDIVIFLTPIAILSLVSYPIAIFIQEGNLQSLSSEVGLYFITVSTGLIFHGFVSLSLVLVIFKINPYKFLKAMFPAVATAFSTASSTATLPLTIDRLRKNGVKDKIAGFVAPLGSTVNMDGTAIYEAVAAVFIANMYGIDLSLTQQLIIFLTATFSAIGAAGIPGAGITMMTMVLASVNLPLAGISLIIGIDRILDMIRTSVNVYGDSIGAKIINKLENEN